MIVVVGCVVVVVGTKLKFAVTVTVPVTVVTHWPVPEQPPPLQPAKVEPEAAVAVSVTSVLLGYVSVQSLPQFILASELATVPAPVPDLEMTKLSNNCPALTGQT